MNHQSSKMDHHKHKYVNVVVNLPWNHFSKFSRNLMKFLSDDNEKFWSVRRWNCHWWYSNSKNATGAHKFFQFQGSWTQTKTAYESGTHKSLVQYFRNFFFLPPTPLSFHFTFIGQGFCFCAISLFFTLSKDAKYKGDLFIAVKIETMF